MCFKLQFMCKPGRDNFEEGTSVNVKKEQTFKK
jgi:hypothetical protein